MEKYVELIKLLEKIFGKGAVSRTIGTRTNVVRFPKGKQPIDPTRSELDVEGSAAKNPDLAQTIENSIADRMGDITKMNDQELLTYTANVRRLVNFKEPPPLPDADVVKFGSGEEIKGKGLEQLIEKQGTKNPPTTVAGQLETQGKKLEKAGEDLKEITEPRSLVGDMLKDYADFDKYMQSSQKTGYVRATVRQIMREDIQAGKLKLPKELQDQVMQGIGEPIDIYRKVYGEGALEQIDSLADDLGQFRTEEEAAKFARSKYTFEPKVKPVDESKTYEELEDILKKDPEPEGKADGGRIGFNKGKRVKSSIDKLLEQLNKKTKGKKSMESVDPKTGEVTVPKRPIRRAEESTGMTTMDPEPEIIDEKSVSKVQQKTTAPTEKQYYMYDKNDEYDKLVIKHKKAAEAHDELDNIDIYDKIAPDQLGDVMAEMEGKNVDKLTDAQRREYYKKAQSYLTDFIKVDRTRRAVEKANEGLELTATDRLYLKFAQPETKAVTVPEQPTIKVESEKPIEGGFDFNDSEIKAQMEKAMQEGNKRSKEMRAMGLDPAKSKDYDEYIKIKEESGDKNFNKYFDDLEIKTKFKGVISDDLLNQILIDDNPQRKAEVIATIEQGLTMQEKGMSPEEIVNILKNTTRTKQAEGGIAGLL
jgi:hypothetical protein